MTSRHEVPQSLIVALTKIVADQGMLVQSSWKGMDVYLKDFPDAEKYRMRMCFYLGCQHVFASIMNFMDDDIPADTPSDVELNRMALLDDELRKLEPSIRAWLDHAKSKS